MRRTLAGIYDPILLQNSLNLESKQAEKLPPQTQSIESKWCKRGLRSTIRNDEDFWAKTNIVRNLRHRLPCKRPTPISSQSAKRHFHFFRGEKFSFPGKSTQIKAICKKTFFSPIHSWIIPPFQYANGE